jgi:hypothetical protein
MEFDMQHLNIDERGPIYSSLLRPFTAGKRIIINLQRYRQTARAVAAPGRAMTPRPAQRMHKHATRWCISRWPVVSS